MRMHVFSLAVLAVCVAAAPAWAQDAGQTGLPHLEKRGAATQLIVDGQPFLMLSGELHNSSASSLEYMKPIWPELQALGLNTVVTPLSWELVEPQEGRYDYALVDGLIEQARQAHQRIVFLWLATWKNGVSSYAPVWVKQNTKRFPRVVERGAEVETLSTLGDATLAADERAYVALMEHIKKVDGSQHTVVMMQLENEVGVLGDTRDHSEAANRAFAAAAPAELMAYLAAHSDDLDPQLKAVWQANGAKTSGTWAEVFGDTPRGDEIFMAWHYAQFVRGVARAGKAKYDIPMYVNTWLASDLATPGEYPSGGPEPWVVDVWKAAGAGIDFYSPDLYATNFEEWSRRYHRAGNPLYMPETCGLAAGAANVFYALGEEAGMGFSPFAIESEVSETDPLGESYHLLASLTPLILEHQSAGDIHGFVLNADHPSADFTMNGYTLHVTGLNSRDSSAVGFGLIMATGPNEFLGAGKGFHVTFTPRQAAQAGIAAIDEGKFEDGKWIPGRRLNGDENEGGKAWRFDASEERIEKIALYRYE